MGVDLLNVGRSALFANKKSMQTTGHNIANINTEGFSRQRAIHSSNYPQASGNINIGTGVNVEKIEREHDIFIEKKLSKSISDFNYNKEKSVQLGIIEDIFNEINSEKFSQILNKFFNSFRELSLQPESDTVRSLVRENAKILINEIKKNSEALEETSQGIDSIIEQSIESVNSILDKIAELNLKIKEIESIHGETGDFRDQRDLLVSQLSEYFEVQTYLDNSQNYIVTAKGVGTLVASTFVQGLQAFNLPPNDSSYFPSQKNIIFKGRNNFPVSNNFTSGKINALIEVRKNDLTNLKGRVDNLVFMLGNAVNSIHKQGHTISQNSENVSTNIPFFNIASSSFGASESFDLSQEIKSDLNNIVTALTPGASGDNRIAIAISKLQFTPIADGENSTLEDYYLKSVGALGVSAAKAKMNQSQSEAILAQIKGIRERISGVSLDEETANMLRFQHAFNASAQVMKTAEDMFQAVLNIKR